MTTIVAGENGPLVRPWPLPWTAATLVCSESCIAGN